MKMSEKMKKLLSIVLCLLMLVQYVPVHAHAAEGTKTIYLKAGVWDVDGAWFWVHPWNGSATYADTKMVKDGDYYKVEVPADTTQIIFIRMNPSQTGISWDNGVWNKTADLTIGGNLYTVTGWGNTDGNWSHKHIPGAAATCCTDQTCTVCGNVLNAATGAHTYTGACVAVPAAPTNVPGLLTFVCKNDAAHNKVVAFDAAAYPMFAADEVKKTAEGKWVCEISADLGMCFDAAYEGDTLHTAPNHQGNWYVTVTYNTESGAWEALADSQAMIGEVQPACTHGQWKPNATDDFLMDCGICGEFTCRHESHGTDGKCGVCGKADCHIFENDTCDCGYTCNHEKNYADVSDATHTAFCACGKVNETVAHTYTGSACACGKEVPTRIIYFYVEYFEWEASFVDSSNQQLNHDCDRIGDGYGDAYIVVVPVTATQYYVVSLFGGGGGDDDGKTYQNLPSNRDTLTVDTAGVETWTCSHPGYAAGKCTLCGEACSHTGHSQESCPICGLTEGIHTYNSSVCASCGAPCPHTVYENGKCTACGKKCTHEGETASYIYYDDDMHKVTYPCGASDKAAHTISGDVCTACGGRIIYVDMTATSFISSYLESSTSNIWYITGDDDDHIGYTVIPGDYNGTVRWRAYQYDLSSETTTVPADINCLKLLLGGSQDFDVHWYSYPCTHNYVDGVCSICKDECSHNWEEGICTKCAYECPHSSHGYNGECYLCSLAVGHTYDAYGKCGCGLSCYHEEMTGNICNACGMHQIHLFTNDGKQSYYNYNAYWEIRSGNIEIDMTEVPDEEDHLIGFLPANTGDSFHFTGGDYEVFDETDSQDFTFDGSFNAFRVLGFSSDWKYIIKTFTHPHEHSYANRTGACDACGLLCRHGGWNEAYECLACGAECAHESYNSGTSKCNVCGKPCEHTTYYEGRCVACRYACSDHQLEGDFCTVCDMRRIYVNKGSSYDRVTLYFANYSSFDLSWSGQDGLWCGYVPDTDESFRISCYNSFYGDESEYLTLSDTVNCYRFTNALFADEFTTTYNTVGYYHPCSHDQMENGVCPACGYICSHNWDENYDCTVCGMHHDHAFSNGYCSGCRQRCTDHQLDEKGFCAVCDMRLIYSDAKDYKGISYTSVWVYYDYDDAEMIWDSEKDVWYAYISDTAEKCSFLFDIEYVDIYLTGDMAVPEAYNCFRPIEMNYSETTGVWYSYPCTNHDFTNKTGACDLCGAECAHDDESKLTCVPGTNAEKHNVTCGICGGIARVENHTAAPDYTVNTQDNTKHDKTYSCCSMSAGTADHTLDYKDLVSATHTVYCSVCDYEQTVNHSYTDGICVCGELATYTLSMYSDASLGTGGVKIVSVTVDGVTDTEAPFTVKHGLPATIVLKNIASVKRSGVYVSGVMNGTTNLASDSYTLDKSTNTLTIPADTVTGNVTVEAQAYVYVQIELNGGTVRGTFEDDFEVDGDVLTLKDAKVGMAYNLERFVFLNRHEFAGVYDGTAIDDWYVCLGDAELEFRWNCTTPSSSVTKVAGTPATCLAKGELTRYVCTCGTIYADKDGTQVLTSVELPVDPDNHAQTIVYVDLDEAGHKTYYPCCQSEDDAIMAAHTYDATTHECACADVERFTVTWMADGKTVDTSVVTYGEAIAAINGPDKVAVEGKNCYYAFTGWNGYTDGMTMPGEDLTFTAKYADTVTHVTTEDPVYSNVTEKGHDRACAECGLVEAEQEKHSFNPDTGKCVCGEKATPTVTAPTALTGLEYTGNAQTLISAGSTTGGTIHYKLGADGTYGTKLPTAVNAGEYTVYYKVVGNDNYKDVAEQSVTVTVDKAPVPGFFYPDVLNEITYGQKLEEAKLEFYSNDYGTFNWVEPTAVADSVGTKSYNMAFYPTDLNNYKWDTLYNWKADEHAAWVEFDVKVNKAQGIGSVDMQDWVYGELAMIPQIQSETNGTDNVTVLYKVKGADDSTYIGEYPADPGDYTIKVTFAATEHYTEAVATDDFTIEKMDLAASDLTFTQPSNLVYDGSAKTPMIQAANLSLSTGMGAFTYKYYDSEGKLLNGEPVNAGTYTLKIDATEGALYKAAEDVTADSWTFTIEKAQAVIDVDDTPIEVTYGETVVLPEATSNFGSVTCNLTSAELVNAGTYNVIYSVVDADNYHGARKTVAVTVNPKALTEDDVVLGGELTYNGSEQTKTVTVTEGITYEISGATATDAGDYTIKVTASGNYTGSVTKQWSIGKRDIADAAVTLGGGLTYNGKEQTQNVAKVEIDGLRVTYDVSGNKQRDAGQYTLTIAGNGNFKGEMTAPWSIAKAALTVTAQDHAITYGDAPAHNGMTGNGFVNSENFVDLSGELAYAYDYEQFGNVGTYKITLSGLTSGNYEITFVPGTLTVKAKAVEITADAKNKVYGDADPELTYQVKGLVNNDKLTGALQRAEGENVGTYTIGQGTLAASDNYTVTYTGAELTVSKRAVTVTAKDQTIVCGGKISGTAFAVTGLAEGHSATVTLTPSTDKVTTGGTITADVAAIIAGGTDVTANYEISYAGGKLVIEPNTSKIDDLTDQNVTSADEENIKAVLDQITAGEETAQTEWADLTETCEKLIEKIEQVEAEKTAAMEGVTDFDEDTVTSADKAKLEALSEDVEALLDSKNLTWAERTALEETLEQVQAMMEILEETAAASDAAMDAVEKLDAATVNSADKKTLEQAVADMDELLAGKNLTEAERKTLTETKADAKAMLEVVEAAQAAAETDKTEKVENVTAENVKPEDKTALTDAKVDMEKALKDHADNYTEEEKKAIQTEVQRIEAAIATLEHAETVVEAVKVLPESVEPDDEQTEEKILAAKADYDALTDYEKSLVDETTVKKLNALVAALTDYEIIKGDGGKWTQGSGQDLGFTANGAFSKFTMLKVDGKEVDKRYYDAKSGSTIITLKESYLKKLSAGKHTITVVYTNGETSGTFQIKSASDVPATGDNSNMLFWTFSMTISLAAMALLLAQRKKRTAK